MTPIIDIKKVKLGKQTARHDCRTLMFADYLHQLPPFPSIYDWTKKASSNWGMMKNDIIGDCTCAAAGHLIQEWTADFGNQITPTDKQIVAAYSAITGYNPNTGLNDNGAVEIDVLNYWRRIGIAGHKITAYTALEPKNINHVKAGIYLFGGAYIGLSLPISAQSQSVWSVPPGGPIGNGAPGSWGGHAVIVLGYDEIGLTCITWGQPLKMTWQFWNTYCDEAYVIISPDFIKNNKTPIGIDYGQLILDANSIKN